MKKTISKKCTVFANLMTKALFGVKMISSIKPERKMQVTKSRTQHPILHNERGETRIKQILEYYEEIFSKMNFYVDSLDTDKFYAEFERTIEEDGQQLKIVDFQCTDDKFFEAFIRTTVRNKFECNEVPSFRSVLRKFLDEALIEGRSAPVSPRIQGNEDETVYFLADKGNHVIHVTATGVNIKNSLEEYKFYKKTIYSPQVFPEKSEEGLLDLLSPLLNMEHSMKVLFTANLVQQFLCTSSHFLSVISSGRGTGKSMFTSIWKKIVDPSKGLNTAIPSNLDELKNHLANNYFIALDNIQSVNTKISDLLCGAITGTSITKRKLYTDSEEVVVNLHNIIIFNGIDAIPKNADLLERSLLFQLNPISSKERLTEAELNKKFDKILPQIMYNIFQTLKIYFSIRDSTIVEGNHRMSGAYKDCYIIATALNLQKEFCSAFEQNQMLLTEQFTEINPLVSAILTHMHISEKTTISGKMHYVYMALKPYCDERFFPKSSSAFSRELKKQEAVLFQSGISVVRTRDNTGAHVTISLRDKNILTKEEQMESNNQAVPNINASTYDISDEELPF